MSDPTESLQARLERFERERLEAYERYNDALTALDRSIGLSADLPHPPPALDPTGLDVLNDTWDVLPAGAPVVDGSIKGRLRGFIWRIVGPSLEGQRRFNAALVEHLNRNVQVHAARREAAESTLAFLGDQLAALARFQSHLIQFLQTVIGLVDSTARSSGARVEVVNAAISDVVDHVQRHCESLATHDARRQRAFDAVSRDVETARAAAALAQQTALSLKREVERWLAPDAVTAIARRVSSADVSASLESFKYLTFENEFRGAVEQIRGRLAAYVPLFEGHGPVLDLGCGRGEFLDLLRAQGIAARGIDINDAMVEETRARGLEAEKADALTYLSGLADESLGGIFAAQVIEHLPADYLTALVEVAGRKVRPGGIVVLETINPTCWVAFFESYIRDLTHVRPLHPETMQHLLRVSGFRDVRLEYSSPVDAEGTLRAIPADASAVDDPLQRATIETVNRNMAILNGRLFGFQDYAVIGTK